MNTQLIHIKNPDGKNFIFGQSHFIKTVEDLHEAIVSTVPGAKFGLAFCEASGPRIIRTSGTDEKMIELAVKNAQNVGCGHTFFIFMDDMFPINILPTIKRIPEIVRIFCATANPTQVVVVDGEHKTAEGPMKGRGVVSIIDGGGPLGVEDEDEKKERINFLRKIGYKLG